MQKGERKMKPCKHWKRQSRLCKLEVTKATQFAMGYREECLTDLHCPVDYNFLEDTDTLGTKKQIGCEEYET